MKQNYSTKCSGIRAYIGSHAFWWDVATVAIGALLTRVTVLGDGMPFCAAFLSACGMCGFSIHGAFLSGALAMLLIRPIPLSTMAMCALQYALLLAFSRMRRRFGKFERLLLLLASQAALLPVFTRTNVQMLLRGVICAGVSVLAALTMQNALSAFRGVRGRHVLTDGEQMSVSALFGILLLSVSDVAGFGASLSVALLLVYAMIACYARGLTGVAAAVAIACALTVGGDFALPFVGGVSACALFGASLRHLGKGGVVGGFAAACLLLGTYVYSDPRSINLLNLSAASAVLLLLPKARLLSLGSWLDANRDRERYAQKSVQRMRMLMGEKLRQTAEVIGTMAHLYERGADAAKPEDDAEAPWMIQAAFGVCVDCTLKKVCWKDREMAGEVARAMARSYGRGENVRATEPFDRNCRSMLQMAAAAYSAQNQFAAQQAMEKQQRAQHAFMRRQLENVTRILLDLAGRIERDRWLDEDLEETLLAGLDRRGFRVFGADAFFPAGKLILQLRILRKQMYQLEPFTEAVQRVLHRPVRVLRALPDGRFSLLVLEEAQAYSASMGSATMAKGADGVSGDCAGERRMERGRVLYALSDGMGTGEKARAESDAALRLLFDLYEAGFSRDVALESVNRLLLHNGGDMYATLDAVHVDLKTGEAEFMKYGAPPSFLYRGGKLHPVQAEALPAGIVSEAIPAIAKTKLLHDDAIILLSDGALEALGSETSAAVGEALSETPDSLSAAKRLLARAGKLRREDDMTVMVIRIA